MTGRHSGTMGPRTRLIAGLAASLFMMPASLVACGDDHGVAGDPSQAWRPLAVVAGPPSGNEALISGTLVVSDACVTIRSGSAGEEALLVWPAEGTSWNSDTRTIEYDDGQERVELSDGDRVAFGGGGSSTEEDGLRPSEWVDSVDWISRPDASCPMEVRWFIGELSERPPPVP